MKVLWIINMVLPDVAAELNMRTSFSGGWLVDYANRLVGDPNIELATMTYANVETDMDAMACGMRNFIFAGGGKRLLHDHPQTQRDCLKVLNAFQPDVIHIHGTEYAIGAAMVRLKPDIPIVLTIQGILTRISEEYYGGLSFRERLEILTWKGILKCKTPLTSKLLFQKNAIRERYVLRNVKHVTGRTDWDKSVMLSINDDLTYHRLPYNLREPFYSAEKWNIHTIDRHTVYTGAAQYTLKGLHILLRAIAIVKQHYPDVSLRIPANNADYQTASGYERYVLRLIKKLGIQDNVCFIGRKDAAGVAKELQKAHVCVVPSAMEGASATMCEAMMVGTPGICSYRGGMTALLRDGDSGFFYDFKEFPVLALRIMELFSQDELCLRFSREVIQFAENFHDRERNYLQLLKIYEEILTERDDA